LKRNSTHGFTFSATDLSNHLACEHLTQLHRKVALGELTKPSYYDPTLELLRARGKEHEDKYVKYLKKKGLSCVDLSGKDEQATVAAMQNGADVIIQAKLVHSGWMGYADILIKVPEESKLGKWSYEVQDTKLGQETRPGAVLQLLLYADIIEIIQGHPVEKIHVVKPGDPFTIDSYRRDDFKAYYSLLKRDFVASVHAAATTYPVPVSHCNICAWWKVCADKRREDDHLSLVAGIRSVQVEELEKQTINTLAGFARAESVSKPERGNLRSLLKKKDQAAIQLKGREEHRNAHKILLPQEEDRGFLLLPKPSKGDIYFDIEGDRNFPDGPLEYLLGYYYQEDGGWKYEKLWAHNRKEEKQAFRKFMKFVLARWKEFPGMCIYHYAPYEPTALKRLSRTYAMHELDVDKLLRGQRLVDLHSVVKGALIASVERYSLKDMEKFTGFVREVDLRQASLSRRYIECSLESDDPKSITPEDRTFVEGYNQDDCAATQALHSWLEKLRTEAKRAGAELPRLAVNDGEPDPENVEVITRAMRLREAMIRKLPEEREKWNAEHHAVWLLAHQVDYFDREAKSSWWEYFAIRKMDDDELLEHKKVIWGLENPTKLPRKGQEVHPTFRYHFPPQDSAIQEGDKVDDVAGETFGTVIAVSYEAWTIDIRIPETPRHIPRAVQQKPLIIPHNALADSLYQLAQEVNKNGLVRTQFHIACQLLLKEKPRLKAHRGANLFKPGENHIEGAIRLAEDLDKSILAIQGPPGSGKTYTGAKMILALVQKKKKIGVTAVSHKAIRNLLAKVKSEADREKIKVTVAHKSDDSFDEAKDGVAPLRNNPQALEAVENFVVVGGTAWLWAREDAINSLDYLFVDEAGQMSLTYVLAASRCAKNLILLGDPQQLEQPQQGSHPEGSGVAALTHLLDGHQTIPPDRGIFIPTTRRLHPAICQLTSELFYEKRLNSMAGLEKQAIGGKTAFAGSGLLYVPVDHTGNQSKSTEEVAAVKRIVDDLMANGTWTSPDGKNRKLEPKDIAIVTPYNAQIAALETRLAGFAIGTVDKFQGQEAPVVIYSMASSSAEEAPRGMEFLYSPNRFNVATSRAMTLCILVASPKLFEPECHTVDQMRWANAICRYKELSK
jgi:uncharacterized protein